MLLLFSLFSIAMSGDRPSFDYEMDIFGLLVDLVERPSSPTCNTCLLTQIIIGLISLNSFLIIFLLYAIKRVRLQYSVGKPI